MHEMLFKDRMVGFTVPLYASVARVTDRDADCLQQGCSRQGMESNQ